MKIISFFKSIFDDTQAVMAEILVGVSLMITGLATLFVGNYIVYSIISALSLPSGCLLGEAFRSPGMNTSCTAFNGTVTSLTTYTGTIIPVFGLAFLVAGFGLILYTLRATGTGQPR